MHGLTDLAVMGHVLLQKMAVARPSVRPVAGPCGHGMDAGLVKVSSEACGIASAWELTRYAGGSLRSKDSASLKAGTIWLIIHRVVDPDIFRCKIL